MKDHNPRRRIGRVGALALLLLLSASSFARITRNDSWARDKFAAAEELRVALAAHPAGERARHDYQRVIDGYRRVYLGCPTCTKADPSVVTTAEILLEMGRQFHDEGILRSAVKQYQFLRREYPGSKSRSQALFTIGEIYKNDINEPSQAEAAFQEYLRRYPGGSRVEDARSALSEQDHRASPSVEAKQKTTSKKKVEEDEAEEAAPVGNSDASADSSKAGKYVRVTGILHWNGPEAARVAIDLEDEVQFKSERLEHPSRIYFDLRDTHLSGGLAGKVFDVQGGVLKKIRVAQFEQGRSRVVLEVDPETEYKAFLAQNPNRLIIEIQGKKTAKGAESARSKSAPDVTTPAVAPAASISKEGTGPAALPQLIAVNKPAPAVTNPVPKRIVEADDDDDDDSAVPSGRRSSAKRKASISENRHKPAGNAMASARKHRSADGNDDEVATLGPSTEVPPRTTSPAATVPGSGGIATSKSRHSGLKDDSGVVDMREAQPTMAGDRSLIRALGLKIGRIVIDPGHGGHDTGTIGPNGVEEKNVVLDVARRLGKLLRLRMGADVIYTREDDTFIPLEERTAIANEEQADLFVSIHANSSHDEDARGVETYYLNFTSNAAALDVAARENAASDKSIHELQDLVKKIALKEKIEESREFATDVQRSLHSGLALKSPGIRDRGVKKAPFVVLIGANMPSILAEISFVSNPTDERKLTTPEYRQRIAESLYKGISKYVSGLSGVKVAARMTKSDSQ